MSFIVQFLNLLLTILWLALLSRVILSWISAFAPGNPIVSPNNPIVLIIHQLTEPILAPLRRIIPPIAGFDFTPLIAFFLIILLRNFVARL